MPSAVVRMYESEKQARKAVASLKAEGFAEGLIHLVTPSPEGAAASAEVLAGLVKAGKLSGDTKVYQEGLGAGRSLVIVEPPFGQAQEAIAVLEGLNPIPVVVAPKAPAPTASASRAASAPAWDDATPLSSALGFRVLSEGHRPTPFSEMVGFNPLSKGFSWGSPYFKLLRPHNSGFSALFGLKLLKEDPTPFSSFLGIKILTEAPRLGEGDFTRPAVAWDPTPLSTKLDFKVLSENPTPLSSALGVQVLSPPKA